MPPPDRLRALTTGADAMLWGRRASIWLGNMAWGSTLGRALAQLQGAHVLLRASDPLFAALALIELDGIAARIVLAPSGMKDEQLPDVIARAAIDAVVSDDAALAVPGMRFVRAGLPLTPLAEMPPPRDTEFVLFTGGATGIPKLVSHNLASLMALIRTDAVRNGPAKDVGAKDIVWGTFYDVRRYGGLHVLLRALTGRVSLVLPDAWEEAGDFLVRLGRHRVTHLAGAPSHWRQVLMNPANLKIAPRAVRLSGEIADQAILDSLKARFPEAAVAHVYAATETGVCFEVADGSEGFPASFLGQPGAVELKLADGSLHVRSPRMAQAYLGKEEFLTEGFVDTGDLVELWGDRCFFTGRRGAGNAGAAKPADLQKRPEPV